MAFKSHRLVKSAPFVRKCQICGGNFRMGGDAIKGECPGIPAPVVVVPEPAPAKPARVRKSRAKAKVSA